MSYEIVKSIKIDEQQQKVFINSHSNNDTATYSNEEYPYFSKILKEKGLQETELALFKNFEEGNLQSSQNSKYTRALKVLYYLFGDEYKKFSWRNNGEDYEKAKVLRESQEFRALLLKALNTQLPKEKFIIHNNGYYARKETSRHLFYTNDLSQAKKYDFKSQAESTAKRFKFNNFEIVVTKKEQNSKSKVYKDESIKLNTINDTNGN